MTLKRVWIIEGCISCGACGAVAPDVFSVEDIAQVKEGIDVSVYEHDILEAAGGCPVSVIKYE